MNFLLGCCSCTGSPGGTWDVVKDGLAQISRRRENRTESDLSDGVKDTENACLQEVLSLEHVVVIWLRTHPAR